MNGLLKAAGVLCLCGYITGIVTNLIPLNQMEKSVRLVTVLYIISVVFSQKIEYSKFLYVDLNDRETISQSADTYVIEMAEAELENNIAEILNEKNIAYSEVSVHINKQTDKIQIDKVYIYGSDSDNYRNAKAVLSDILPQECIVQGEYYNAGRYN